MAIFKRWWGRITLGVILVIGLVFAFWPRPIPADLGTVTRGSMQVTVSDDGETRVREVYTLSAPFSARVMRFEGDVGDPVVQGESILANLMPSDPVILDVRARSELEAMARAAQADLARAEAEVKRTTAELDLARSDYARIKNLAASGTASKAQLDRALSSLRALEAAGVEGRAARDVAEFQVERAKAALIGPEDPEGQHTPYFAVPAPVSGRILRIYQESEKVVAAGTPLVEIGDPRDLEIVVDLLSTDAVKVSPGDKVLIERWGGPMPLNGEVRRVEPFGFTKISSLGIEEQRVNVIIDITDPPETWARLGHGYRIEASVILWQGADALQVPVSALFRQGAEWAVFAVVDGRARTTPITIGHMNDRSAEVLGGLAAGDIILLHPSDRISDGVLVTARQGG